MVYGIYYSAELAHEAPDTAMSALKVHEAVGPAHMSSEEDEPASGLPKAVEPADVSSEVAELVTGPLEAGELSPLSWQSSLQAFLKRWSPLMSPSRW